VPTNSTLANIDTGATAAKDCTLDCIANVIKRTLIRTLVRDHKQAGYYEKVWDGKDNYGKNVSSGMYMYRLKAGKYVSTKKMILMK